MNWNLNWSNGSEFLAMGGYGLYVWGSFGVTALVMVIEVWSLAARRKAVRHLTRHHESTNLESPE